jgi:Flp pilus assembly protein TadD
MSTDGSMPMFRVITILAMLLVPALFQALQADDTLWRPLEVPKSSPARRAIVEGIKHYNEGHMDVASHHFRRATEADPQSAEAHYNLALALDGLGDHLAAAKAFEQALTLAPDDPAISESAILKKHVDHHRSELIKH